MKKANNEQKAFFKAWAEIDFPEKIAINITNTKAIISFRFSVFFIKYIEVRRVIDARFWQKEPVQYDYF